MKIAKKFKDLIASGEICESKRYMKEFPKYTYHFFTRIGTEEHTARSLEKTMALAEELCQWASKNGARTEIGEPDWAWYNVYDNQWEKITYIPMGITDPAAFELDSLIETNKVKEGTVLGKEVILRSLLPLTTEMPEEWKDGMPNEKLYGYFRADHDGYGWHYTWFDGENAEKKDAVKEELNAVGTEVIFRMFPGGIQSMRLYLADLKVDAIGSNEYNLYYRGKCDYWVRLILRRGDYNIYLKAYERVSENL